VYFYSLKADLGFVRDEYQSLQKKTKRFDFKYKSKINYFNTLNVPLARMITNKKDLTGTHIHIFLTVSFSI